MSELFPTPAISMEERFRGYLPVVIDVETAGFDSKKNALLEVGLCFVEFNEEGKLQIGEKLHFNVKPFEGAEINKESCAFIQIDPYDPNREADDEKIVVKEMCKAVSAQVKKQHCKRAIIVGHNAHFDLGFIMQAIERCRYKRSPFHPFSCIDTASISAIFYGQTVLSVSCEKAGVLYENEKAHGALYDATVTAELFCNVVNNFRNLNMEYKENTKSLSNNEYSIVCNNNSDASSDKSTLNNNM